MASKRSKREENKLEAEILRLELTLKAHKMACQMGVPGACEAADAVREDIEVPYVREMIRRHAMATDVPAELARADLVALTTSGSSRSERYTSPLKVYESMAAGLPLVVSGRLVLDVQRSLFRARCSAYSRSMALMRPWQLMQPVPAPVESLMSFNDSQPPS